MASTLPGWASLVWIISFFIIDASCSYGVPFRSAVSGPNAISQFNRIKRQASFTQCGKSTITKLNPLIIGGAEANVGSFPWHAGLYFRQEENGNVSWVQKCGGSLITDQFVLTAAHCLRGLRKLKDLRVAVGKYVRSWDHNEDNQQKSNVSKVICPRDYNQELLYFDIALVKLKNKVVFGDFVMPVCNGLSDTAHKIVDKKLFAYVSDGKQTSIKHGTIYILFPSFIFNKYLPPLMCLEYSMLPVAGWGLTEKNGQFSDRLLYTDVIFVPPNACHKLIPVSYSLIEKLCTIKVNESAVSVARQGDSGGGLTVEYEGRHFIVGIVSSALNQVTMFTNVSWPAHVTWIENEIRKHDSSYNWTDTKITCPQSDTLIKGKTVCRGDVIFEDTFSRPGSNWARVVFIDPETTPSQFTVFTNDNENSFLNKGSLVIKPTVYDDAHVTSGTFELEGCTAERGSDDCVRTPSPDRILPPVATAMLTSYPTFSFTYGEVEIRAKLPKGDWLAPVFKLSAKNSEYGSGGSGAIDIAVSRGNKDLQCNGENYGLGQVEFRVTIGPSGRSLYKEFVLNNLSESWFDYYHEYTVVWKPDSIAFKIDEELVGEISPGEKTLCETYTSLTKEDCMIYRNGSKFAPLDKDFFILMGLTVGYTSLFPDGCINRGKMKAWKNKESKAVLKFWQDKENWLPTWTEGRSSLYVDYVRVTAV